MFKTLNAGRSNKVLISEKNQHPYKASSLFSKVKLMLVLKKTAGYIAVFQRCKTLGKVVIFLWLFCPLHEISALLLPLELRVLGQGKKKKKKRKERKKTSFK